MKMITYSLYRIILPAALLSPWLVIQGAAQGLSDSSTESTRLTLQQALEEAQSSNRGLKALGHRRNAAEHSANAIADTRWGELSSSFSYSYLNDDQILRPISEELISSGFSGLPFDRSQMHYGVNFRIPLYLGGQLENEIKIAKLESEKAEALLEGTRWQVRFNVISLYTTAQSLDQVVAALDEQLGALESTKTRLDVMVSEGKRPEVDRLKVIEELEGVKARRANTVAARIKVSSSFFSLLGREPKGTLTVDTLSSRTPVITTNRDDLSLALEGNSFIRQAQLAGEQGESGVKVAKGSYLPKVYVGANYLEHTGTTIDQSLDTWMGGLSVELPLFAGNSRAQKLKAAREKRAAAAEALADSQLKLAAQLEDALARFDAVNTGLVSARAQVDVGTEAARIEQVRYDTGAGTIEDLLRAQAREAAAQAALASAQGSLLTAAARINSIVEKEIVK